MLPNQCIVVDIWEGQTGIDMQVLKANGVSGIGIRLNDMNGGHHMDKYFPAFWAQAQSAGLIRFPYFVYNPWVNGQANFDWLAAHMPGDVHAVAIDIEVRYPGYSAATYAGEVTKFYNLASQKWKVFIYTGQGFSDLLTKWPRIDYWWAQYPNTNLINQCTNWELLRIAMNSLAKPSNAAQVPGNLVMWQFSGDALTLPGSTNKMDVNIFFGSEQDLAAYLTGNSIPAPAPLPTPVPVPAPVPAPDGMLFYVKDDLWPGLTTRPRIRKGEPSTVVVWGGSGFIKLSAAYMLFLSKLNPSAMPYLTKDASGWHNTGDANVMRQLTFSGNLVRAVAIESGKVYIDTYFTDKTPPALAVRPSIAKLDPLTHFFTTQYGNYLDMSTSGRWPLIFPIANPGEHLWMKAEDLVSYTACNHVARVCIPVANVRANPSASSKWAGVRLQNEAVTIYGTLQIGANVWGRLDLNLWMALHYDGTWFTDWEF